MRLEIPYKTQPRPRSKFRPDKKGGVVELWRMLRGTFTLLPQDLSNGGYDNTIDTNIDLLDPTFSSSPVAPQLAEKGTDE